MRRSSTALCAIRFAGEGCQRGVDRIAAPVGDADGQEHIGPGFGAQHLAVRHVLDHRFTDGPHADFVAAVAHPNRSVVLGDFPRDAGARQGARDNKHHIAGLESGQVFCRRFAQWIPDQRAGRLVEARDAACSDVED